MKKVWNEKIAYGLTIAVIFMLVFKWFGLIEASYLVVFSPLIFLVAALIAVLVIGIVILAVTYPFLKNDKRAKRNI